MNRQDIEDFIENSPEERREALRQWQWRLDQDLNKYKDPTARMNRMVEIFWEGVNDFHQTLSNPTEMIKEEGTEEPVPDNVVKLHK